jgi:uncharacterized protein YbjT (DUF2867 family)
VARFVNLALHDPGLRGQAIDVGGPENLTFNELVRSIEAQSGRRAAVRHLPLPPLRVASALLRPFRPDLAGMIQAGLLTDTADMTFDGAELARRFPEVKPTAMREVLRVRFGAS